MQTIDIRTTQNVTIEYELASLRERILAFFIDAIIIIAVYLVLILLGILAFGNDLNSAGDAFFALVAFFPVIGLVGYQLLSEVIADGQSWGKKSLGLKVVRLDGKEPSLTDYLLRAVFHLVDTLFSMGVMAALMISSSTKNQRLGDITANTTVIKIRSSQRFRLEDILKINTIEDYQPEYPAVKQLSEEDMLLVKNVITRYRTFGNTAHVEAIEELTRKMCELLDISEPPRDKVGFLKTLIKDYIVLTR